VTEKFKYKMNKSVMMAALAATALANIDASAAVKMSSAVDEIAPYVSPNNSYKRPAQFTYMPNGTEYALLSSDKRSIETYDIKTGKKTGVLVDLNNVREQKVADISGFIVSPNASKVLIYRNVNMIYRRSFTAEYYVYDLHSRILDKLSTEFDKTQIPVFSPDSRMIAFVAENNIYVKKLDYNTQVAVTEDGAKGKIINGATDWTYEEEFSTISSLAWSPDNSTLCFVKADESDVPLYTLPLYKGACNPMNEYALYPGELSYKYPVAGEKNSKVTLHSYDVETRKIKDIALPDNSIEYIPRIDFGPTAEQLLVSTLNRDQNRYEIYSVNPKTTVAKSIFVEKSKAWIEPSMYEDITFGSDGFVVMSSRSGYSHLYKYSYAGALMRTLTSGNYDVTAYYGGDAAGNYYYQAANPSAIERTVCKVDAKNVSTTISSAHGSTSASFSPNHDYAVLTYSDTKTPPQYTLVTSAGKPVRMLEDNKAFAERFADKIVEKEFIKVPSDGYELNGFIMRPDNFDASQKYPVIMTQYSGPGSQSVLNSWDMGWMQFFAKNGFIVVCVDGRGTGGRGSEFMNAVYCNLGHYETIDQINAAKYVATLPGVDASRIGMHGWSFGGYETLMCVTDKNNPFAAAVAVAPVTDWRYYDTVYTERYMLTPQQNDKGYNESAPLKRAEQLSANLLIMYGTADDNVHPDNSLEFVSELEVHGLLCDMLVFPNKNHSIYGCNARAVVYGKMYDYFKRNL
jgi:dipeptidyl-peptidase-4